MVCAPLTKLEVALDTRQSIQEPPGFDSLYWHRQAWGSEMPLNRARCVYRLGHRGHSPCTLHSLPALTSKAIHQPFTRVWAWRVSILDKPRYPPIRSLTPLSDCLTVDIYVPKGTEADAQLPVQVYIPGLLSRILTHQLLPT